MSEMADRAQELRQELEAEITRLAREMPAGSRGAETLMAALWVLSGTHEARDTINVLRLLQAELESLHGRVEAIEKTLQGKRHEP